MSYADRRTVARFDLKTADLATPAVPDNTDLFSIIIPANIEVELFAFKAHVRTASGAGDSMELCKADNTVLSDLSLVNTGVVSGSGTFPMRVAALTSATYLKLRTNGTLGATTDVTFEVHLKDPGV